MNTLQTDAKIMADGSLKLLSPLPIWLIPGNHVFLTVQSSAELVAEKKSERGKRIATSEMIDRRRSALKAIRALNPYRDITDPVAWQQEMRADCTLPDRH